MQKKMSVIRQPFRISTGLKNLIGQDLITDEFVAVFELVKNAFDAYASIVYIRFEKDRIVISDNGKGMSRDDILNKWLFIAYSAKKEGTEDNNYRRNSSVPTRPFAGAKGIGRFSCDRLGKKLSLYSKAAQNPVQILEINWTSYEEDARKDFNTIQADISEARDFPSSASKPDGDTGTILEIEGLRSEWDRKKLRKMKQELMKLINPFDEESVKFQIQIIAPDQKNQDEEDISYNANLTEDKKDKQKLIVNGNVENPILEALNKRTTVIRVIVVDHGQIIESILEDRGEIIYRIREPNPYSHLKNVDISADIYFLNRKAKAIFARRMGIPSVEFGSIFLFRNGFRVMPIGSEEDDFFGLNRRKQQGQRRFLGSRDLIGRVGINATEGFQEATSRDQGLIRTPEVTDLINFVREKCVRRLERYVADITWKDKYDKDVADLSRMKLDKSSALIIQLVSRLAATKNVELVEYNSELVRIIDERSEAFESSLKTLEILADKTGDDALLIRVVEAQERIRERFKILQASEAAAKRLERQAKTRALRAEKSAAAMEKKYDEERDRNKFLVAATSLDEDTTLNLHHQIIAYAADIHTGLQGMMRKLRKDVTIGKEDWINFLHRVSFGNTQILTASRFATKAGYKKQSAKINDDLVVYISDYITTMSSLLAPRNIKVHVHTDGGQLERTFLPIEIGSVINDLVSNASKARAKRIDFFLRVTKDSKPELKITVADDGWGWPPSLEPIGRVFEKGVTTTNGSGLGLYHVKQIIEQMGGFVEAHREAYSEKLHGAHLTLRIPL